MTLPSKAEAEDFFSQLRRFSKRLVNKALPGTADSSPNMKPYSKGKPKGAILHYTASGNWQSPVKWFNDFKVCSAHVVVAHNLDPIAAGLADDLPLVKALPVTVIQCIDPRQAAWHATWANGLCYGIENRNAGLVKRDNPSAPWRHWPPAKGNPDEWTSLAPKTGQGYVATSDTLGYEPYSKAQLAANVILLRYVGALGGAALEPHWVLPHSAVQGNKYDTGPLFPIHEIRRLACIDTAADPMTALETIEPDEATSGDDLDIPPTGEHLEQAPLQEREAIEAAIAGLAVVEAHIPNKPHAFAHLVRPSLDKLGFFVPSPPDPRVVDVWLRRALWIFQTGIKIEATCVPDDVTRAKLAERLATLGLPA
jgi:hypothetical protein